MLFDKFYFGFEFEFKSDKTFNNTNASYTRFISTSNMVLSKEERIFLVEYVYRGNGKYADEVKKEFIDKFPETDLPHWNTVCNLFIKFRQHGSVKDAPRSGRSTILTEQKINIISETMG